MALIKAFGDSEAAGATSNQGKDSEGNGSGAASCGYTEVQGSQEPATSNADVTTTKSFGADVTGGQEGTSIDAYKHQPKIVSAESGN